MSKPTKEESDLIIERVIAKYGARDTSSSLGLTLKCLGVFTLVIGLFSAVFVLAYYCGVV